MAVVSRPPAIARSAIRGGGVRSTGSASGTEYTRISRGGAQETLRPKVLGFEPSRTVRRDVLVDPHGVVLLGEVAPGVGGEFAPAAGVVITTDELRQFEVAKVIAYFASQEWAEWAEANGSAADVKEEAELMRYRDVSVAEAVAAGIRLVVRADEQAFDNPEGKRFRRMTRSH